MERRRNSINWLERLKFAAVFIMVCLLLMGTNNKNIFAGQVDDVVKKAESEIGYKEGTNNDNKYAKAVGGTNNSSWCAYFVTWCMRQCNISSDIYPSGAQGSCTKIIAWYMKRSGWHKFYNKNWEYNGIKDYTSTDKGFVPRKGDLVFFETNSNYSDGPDHIGIVSDYSGGRVYYINGNNSEGKVASAWSSISSSNIWGFCRPNYVSTPRNITFSQNSLAMNVGESVTINISFSGDDIHYLNATGDGNIASVEWGNTDWSKCTSSIKITGRNAGKTEWTIRQRNSNNEVLYEKKISVEVKEVGKSMIAGAGQTVPDGEYQIVTKLNRDMTLDVPGDTLNIQKGENIRIYTGLNRPCDIFTLTYLNDGFYKIGLKGTNLCLDVQKGGKTPGTNVILYEYEAGDNQKWSISDNGDGSYRIQSKCNGFSLDVTDAKAIDGQNVQMCTDNNSKAQKWIFGGISLAEGAGKTIENGDYYLVTGLNENMTLDVPGDTYDVKSGVNAEIYEGRNRKYDVFSVQYLNNGFYKIKHKGSDLCLDVSGGYNDIKSNVQYYTDNGTWAQQWSIISLGNGKYRIKCRCDGLSLDVYNGIAKNNQNVWIYPDNNTAAQIWEFVSANSGQTIVENDDSARAEAEKAAKEEAEKKAKRDQEAADAVTAKINAIGEITLTDAVKKKIEVAREAYDALTDEQKTLVPWATREYLSWAEDYYNALVDAERIAKEEAEKAVREAEEKTARENQAAADAVTTKINTIGVVVLNDNVKKKISAARLAYDALTGEQKMLVPENVRNKLIDAENTYAYLAEKAITTTDVAGSSVSEVEEEDSEEAYEEFEWEEDQFAIEGILYEEIGSGKVMVMGLADENCREIKIPATVTYDGVTYKVVKIFTGAFFKNKKITSVTIGKNVHTIEASAFAGCTTLNKVTMGKGLKTIRANAFKGDKKLKNIKISSSSIKSVGKNAFKGIPKKAKIKVPKGMVSTYKALFAKKGGMKIKMK